MARVVNPFSEYVREPNLLVTGKNPVGSVKVDWTNALSKNLAHYILFDANSKPHDLVTGKHLSKNGAPYPKYNGYYFDEVDDYFTLANVTLNSSYTIFAALDMPDNTGSAFKYWFSFGSVSAANSLNIYVREAAPGDMFFPTDSGLAHIDAYYQNHNGKAFAIRATASTQNIYMDNADVTAWDSSTVGSEMANGTTNTLYIGCRSDTDPNRFYGGVIKHLIIFDAALPVSAIHKINHNPTEMLVPA